MKEKPILFSAPMARACLDGSKTQTRRIVKPQPVPTEGGFIYKGRFDSEQVFKAMRCPYGVPQNLPWVREAWGTNSRWDDIKPSELPAGGNESLGPKIYYAADFPEGVHPERLNRWRSSIHMPRWASRLTLEIVSVGVERLQDISESDAEAEGVVETDAHRETAQREQRADRSLNYTPSVVAYRELWESINGPGSWSLNSWVWKIEFRRLTEPAPARRES